MIIPFKKRPDAAHSSEAGGFVLTYVPTNPDLLAGKQPVHEYGLPRFGLPHPGVHGWVADLENSELSQHRVDTSCLIADK